MVDIESRMGWVEKQVPFSTIDTYNVFRSCPYDYKFRTKLMLKKGQFYFHASTRLSDSYTLWRQLAKRFRINMR